MNNKNKNYYYLMWKDERITACLFSDSGHMIDYSNKIKNPELAPLQNRIYPNYLIKWWNERSIPIKQGKIQQMLQNKGLSGPDEFLVKNLGLSLSDYYWVCPVDSGLTWKDVNLYQNDFKENLFVGIECPNPEIISYNPNSSLLGQLEKSWIIINGERCLIKGNRDQYSRESLNEVLLSTAHKKQNFDIFLDYNLVKIKNRDYDYGCMSKLFTNLQREAHIAYAVITSEPQPNDKNSYEHFISLCVKNGLQEEYVRNFLEYQIEMDFVFSNPDRHLSNISIIRDPETLKFIGMAPIYDNGKSMFVGASIPKDKNEALNINTNGFSNTELGLLNNIKNRGHIDINKLPDKSFISELYRLDTKMDDKTIERLCNAYELKIELYDEWQRGKDLNKLRVSKYIHNINTANESVNNADSITVINNDSLFDR